MEKSNQNCEVISFISGKGGSGKTTICLGIAKLLSDIGFKVLMIDFDLATSGATYFFLPLVSQHGISGIAEATRAQKYLIFGDEVSITEGTLEVDENFRFLPSRSELGTHAKVLPDADFWTNSFLTPLLKAIRPHFDYVLIDNQAGFNLTTLAAVRLADKAIVVSEADRISSDAVDNLIAMLGTSMPQFRRYLINKLEMREVGDYQKFKDAFRSMNRLPPLPFDFGIRNAFGDRRIPVDLRQPSAFLIGLFTTLKEILPDQRKRLDEYESKTVSKIFDRYQDKLDDLISERNELRDNLFSDRELDSETLYIRRRFRDQMFFAITVSVVGFVGSFILGALTESIVLPYIVLLPAALGLVYGVVSFPMFLSRMRHVDQKRLKTTREEERVRFKVQDIERDIDRYKNLMASRSKELLIEMDLYHLGANSE